MVPELLEPGATVAGRRVVERVRRGAFGVAYKATSPGGGEVQLVVIAAEVADDPRLEHELAFLSRTVAPQVVRVHAVERDPVGLVVVSPWVEGTTVAERLADRGAVSPEEVADLVESAARALGAAEAGGVSRRALPLTSLLQTEPDALRATDFGLAGVAGEERAPGGHVQVLGRLAFALLTGREPLSDETHPRRVAPDVPEALDAAVAHALDPTSDATAEGFVAALRGEVPQPGEVAEPAAPSVTGVRARLGLPRQRGRLALGLLVLALLLVAPALAVLIADDPPQGDVRARALRVSRLPTDVALAGGTVWVTSGADDRVVALEATTARSEVRPRETGGSPLRVAASDTSVWTANAEDGSVTRLNPLVPGDLGRRIEIDADAIDVAVGPDGVWVTNGTRGTITRLDPVSNTVLGRQVRTGNFPSALAIGARYVWVVNSGDGTVARVDPREDVVVGRRVQVGRDPQDIAVGLGSVWVANRGDGTVTRLSADTGRPVGRPIRVGGRPTGLAIGRDALLVLDAGGEIVRVDPNTNEVRPAFGLGGSPTAISVGQGAAWVVDARSGRLIRIAAPG